MHVAAERDTLRDRRVWLGKHDARHAIQPEPQRRQSSAMDWMRADPIVVCDAATDADYLRPYSRLDVDAGPYVDLLGAEHDQLRQLLAPCVARTV